MDPKLIDLILKSEGLRGPAAALFLVCVWLTRELIGFVRRDKVRKEEHTETALVSLHVQLTDLSKEIHTNTIAVVGLSKDIERLDKTINKIPEIERDLDKLGESHRNLRDEVRKLS